MDHVERHMQSDLDRFLQELESERGFSINTIFAYKNDLSQFMGFLTQQSMDAAGGVDGAAHPFETAETGALPLTRWDQLSPAHLSTYLLHLRDRDYATSTMARKTAAIKSFCHFLTKEGQVRNDPAAVLISPKVDKYEPRAISPSEVARLMAQPAVSQSGFGERPEAVRDRAMLETLYATGVRVSELVALDVEDIDVDNRTVRCAGRTNRARVVPLTEGASRALSRYLGQSRAALGANESSALFVNHRGSRLTRQGFWLILKAYAQQADIADITPHTLRHTYATHALRRGAELRDVQHVLGHVSISTTQVYRRMASDGNGRSTRPADDSDDSAQNAERQGPADSVVVDNP